MPLEIVTIPCLSDNYAFLIHEQLTGMTALVDAPEAAPIEAELARRGWGLDFILLTHHHDDHIAAVDTLRAKHDTIVIGAAADAHRLPALDLKVEHGSTFSLAREEVTVIDTPGHTKGHICFHIPTVKALFSADTLMAGGCGRLFEGTPQQMFTSLSKLAALPADTKVYSGHEYTLSNLNFALSVEPKNKKLQARLKATEAARAQGTPTVPSTLADELATNPFLRSQSPELRAMIGMENDSDAAVFAEVRRRKDTF
ncbi:hydroxyacylglutathione hydrolase [Cognatishimia sp. SS12]|uniref:hydroxyacylglutathione hydrolase n=1 Tax=Cognatishimia sp. SS12 TaxID=2979465 RepID=UPI0023304B34|nr:hydroxyacylglutathione hydrolase [Cognatishimia sp. SS12]MDC0738857.1 hydroxyacylglutathione hydrolase [Cognatishimia sp. SS12]